MFKLHYSALTIIFSFTILFVTSCNTGEEKSTNNTARIEGTFKEVKVDTVFLRYRIEKEWNYDSTLIKDESFAFEVELDYPVNVTVYTKDSTKNIKTSRGYVPYKGLSLYAHPGKTVSFVTNYENYGTDTEVIGSPDNEALNTIRNYTKEYESAVWENLTEYYNPENDSTKSAALKIYRENYSAIDSIKRDYYYSNPNSRPAATFIYNSNYSEFDPEVMDSLYQLLSSDIKESVEGLKFKDKVTKLIQTAVGAVAPEFTKIQPDSTFLSLNDFRGKYVLLDFWGSWCGPCRRSHPQLREIYAKYKEKGFEIVAVANEGGDVEKAWEKWTDAIEKDSITWNQVLNDAGKDSSDVVSQYAISAFPTKIFINPDGTIVKKEIGYYGGNSMDSVINLWVNGEDISGE